MDPIVKPGRSAALLGLASAIGLCPPTSLDAAYLPVVGPAPLRWMAPAPPAVLVALPPLDSGKPKPADPTPATATAAAPPGTPAASQVQSASAAPPSPKSAPLEAGRSPNSTATLGPGPGTNPGTPSAEPQAPRTEPTMPPAQLFLPFFRNDGAGDRHPAGAGNGPHNNQGGVIVPFQFNPPTPFRPPSSSATYTTKP